MTAEIVAKFADGRLLVQEVQAAQTHYTSGGLWVRVGHVKTIEKVLSVTNSFADEGLVTNLNEVAISGDQIKVVMRRGDRGNFEFGEILSGGAWASGYSVPANVSGIVVSGNPYLGEIYSGVISGRVTVTANIIGF
jgi:hypothetical protein